MKKTLLITAFIVFLFPVLVHSKTKSLDDRGTCFPSVSGKKVNIAGLSVDPEKDFPDDLADKLRAKKEDAVGDIASVLEQVDWEEYGKGDRPGELFILGLYDVLRDELKTNKKSCLKLKKYFEQNPGSNANYGLLTIIHYDHIKDPDLIQSVVNCTTATAWGVRFHSIEILKEQKDPRFIPQFRKALAVEQDKVLRAHAAGGLAALGEQDGYDNLAVSLDDPEVVVRITAAQELGEIKTEKSKILVEKAIIKAAKTEKNPSVKAGLAESLRRITGRQINEIRETYFGEKVQ